MSPQTGFVTSTVVVASNRVAGVTGILEVVENGGAEHGTDLLLYDGIHKLRNNCADKSGTGTYKGNFR